MLNFKNLTLEDKTVFDKYLKPYKFNTSGYSFTNLFIWRKCYHIQYTIIDDVLIIKKMGFDGSCYFMQPIGYNLNNLNSIIEILCRYRDEFNLDYLFKEAETSFVNDLKSLYGDKFLIKEDRNNFDYIYKSDSLISLSGKKLHSKKNHYNNFIKNYEYETKIITDDLVNDTIKAARKWCLKENCKDHLIYELHGTEEILKNKSKLDFIGMLVYVNGKISAFTIGEKINEEMAIIHIEKADSDIRGLYNFINKKFVEMNFSDVPFINREQDLGIKGLRKAKLSYRPIKLEPKYTIK